MKGACLHSGMTKTHREKTIQNVSDRKIAILFLSPEALLAGSSSTGYMVLLRNLPPVAFVCIDEAHCISEWSHNFRPSYLRVCKVILCVFQSQIDRHCTINCPTFEVVSRGIFRARN